MRCSPLPAGNSARVVEQRFHLRACPVFRGQLSRSVMEIEVDILRCQGGRVLSIGPIAPVGMPVPMFIVMSGWISITARRTMAFGSFRNANVSHRICDLRRKGPRSFQRPLRQFYIAREPWGLNPPRGLVFAEPRWRHSSWPAAGPARGFPEAGSEDTCIRKSTYSVTRHPIE